MTTPPPPDDAPASETFPDAYTPETDTPAYLHVRAEGLPLREAAWSGVGYLRKYRHAKWTAPPEEVAYFDRQRQLLRWLRGRPAAGARLAAVGDLMWLRNGWDDFLAPEVLAYLNGHDLVLGNLETPISPRYRVPRVLPDYFTYNSDPRLLTSFRRPDGGNTFAALATANNHSLDRGDAGLADTLALLDRLGIAHAGVRPTAADRPWVSLRAGDLHVGFYAACWGLNDPAAVRRSGRHIEVLPGLAPRVCHPVDLGRVTAVLADMDAAGVDLRIIGLHWGYEFEFYPCPELMKVGRAIVRAGADLVVGTHPHVVQPLEVCLLNGYETRYRGEAGADALAALRSGSGCLLSDSTGVPRKALIAYSLGNFATTMYFRHCRTGLVLSLQLDRDPHTGRGDWHAPEGQLVYNLHRDPLTHRRRLTLLESHLRDRTRAADAATPLRQLRTWLDHHLFGPAG